MLCESLKNDTGILWKGHRLHWKLEGEWLLYRLRTSRSFFFTSVYLTFASFCAHIQLLCVFVFWDAGHMAVCRSREDGICAWRLQWDCFNRCWGVSMLQLCATNTLVQFLLGCAACWMLELISEYKGCILSSDSTRGVCHGSIAACHTIRNYCNTAGSLMIIISLGLSYH